MRRILRILILGTLTNCSSQPKDSTIFKLGSYCSLRDGACREASVFLRGQICETEVKITPRQTDQSANQIEHQFDFFWIGDENPTHRMRVWLSNNQLIEFSLDMSDAPTFVYFENKTWTDTSGEAGRTILRQAGKLTSDLMKKYPIEIDVLSLSEKCWPDEQVATKELGDALRALESTLNPADKTPSK